MLLALPLFLVRHCGSYVRRRIMAAILVGALAGQESISAATSDTAPRLEYQVKAGYLFNFLRFTEWPPQALPAGAPYRIGVVEDPGTYNIIAETLHGKTVNDRAIEVVYLSAHDAARGCHLIFVPRSVETASLNLGSNADRENTLLVGETTDYAVRDGMIGFVQRGHNIRFQVNLQAAQHAGLKLSGRLASLAEIVQPPSP